MSLSFGQRLGRLQQVILALLWDEEMYGLEIQRGVSVYGYRATSGQLYPALQRLEENDCVQASERIGVGASRKYYRITEKGRKSLIENVLDQVKILEILAAKRLSKVLIESGQLDVGEGDVVVQFSDLRFTDIESTISDRVGARGCHIIVTGNDRDFRLLREWIAVEVINDRVKIVQAEGGSIEVDDDSVDLVLILFRMHLDGSSWILFEARRIIGEGGRVLIFDLLDRGDDFRSDLYGSVLPDHSGMGVKIDVLRKQIELNDLEVSEEFTERGLIIMVLNSPIT
jgi:DNA-binding PadR family transcriptional regulator